jgi:hypothetical protein
MRTFQKDLDGEGCPRLKIWKVSQTEMFPQLVNDTAEMTIDYSTESGPFEQSYGT